jgi:signal peptidase II
MPRSTLSRALIVAAIIVVLDRGTKIWVVEALDLRTRLHIPVVEPWLNFRMAWNTGINFGLFDAGGAGRWALIVLAMVITAGLIIWVRRAQGWAAAIGAGAIIGGALGNVWDRVQYGAVADFLNVTCCGIDNPFAFNLADAAIFGGVAVLLLFVRDGAAAPKGRGGV